MCWSAPRWQRHVGAGVQPWLRERNPCVLYCLRPSTTLKQCVRSRKHSGAHAHGPIANCSKPIEAHVLTVHPRSIADLQVDNFFDPCVADAALPPHFTSVALHLCHQLPRDKLHLCCNLRRDNVARHAGPCQRRRWRRRGDALANCAQLLWRGRGTCPAVCTLAGAPGVPARRCGGARSRDARSTLVRKLAFYFFGRLPSSFLESPPIDAPHG